MFSTSIHEIKKESGVVKVTVIFTHATDPNLSFTHVFVSRNIDGLKSSIQAKIDDVVSTYAFADTLPIGTIDPTPATLTQAEIDKNAFFQKYAKWIQVKKLIDSGIVTGNETAVVNLLNEVKTLFKPAYLADM